MSETKVNYALEILEPRELLATFVWNGNADDSLWNTVENWTADGNPAEVLPGQADTVTIPSGAILTLDSNTSIMTLNNSGNLTVAPGFKLTILAYSALSGGTFAGNIVANNATMEFNSDYVVEAGSSITAYQVNVNNGTLTVNGGWNVLNTNVNAQISTGHGWTRGRIVFNTNVTIKNLVVEGGAYLGGTGNVYVTDSFVWGGSLSGTGILTLAYNSVSEIYNDTFARISLAKPVENFGTITWTQGTILSVPDKAIFDNYGIFEVESDYNFWGASQFNNYGKFIKTIESDVLNTIEPHFFNSGIYSGISAGEPSLFDPVRFNFLNLHDGIAPYLIGLSEYVTSYGQTGKPVTVDRGLTITDPEPGTRLSNTLTSAMVTITGGTALDILSFTPVTGITGVFDSGTGILRLTGEASLADYQTVLQSVKFSSNGAVTANRTITFAVYGDHASGMARRTIQNISLSPIGMAFLMSYEDLRLQTYNDATQNTVTTYDKDDNPTIGYGHLITSKAEFNLYKNGITADDAYALFQRDVNKIIAGVASSITVSLSQNQIDALMIMAFNVGVGQTSNPNMPPGFKGSKILKMINDTTQAPNYPNLQEVWESSFVTRKGGGNVPVPGLQARRAAEYRIFSQGIYER